MTILAKRFTPGTQHLFFLNVFKRPDGQTVNYHHSNIGENIQLIETKIISLTCLEQHEVPVTYSHDALHDGYIFVDNEGGKFYNQYPSANLSLTACHNDYLVTSRDGLFSDYIHLESMMDELLRVKSTSPNDKKVLENIRTYLKENDYEVVSEPLFDDHPDFLVTMIKKAA